MSTLLDIRVYCLRHRRYVNVAVCFHCHYNRGLTDDLKRIECDYPRGKPGRKPVNPLKRVSTTP